jgi:CelD/BcsL family acetyltransferase involved in cellulose biosynthesis
VGGALSDHHAVIADPRAEWTVEQLLRGSGLRVFEFNHLKACQTEFLPWHRERDESPLMLLAGGYEAYARERREAGSKQIKKTGTLRRKLEREVGPLRFTLHAPEDETLRTLLAWKSEQYLESGLIDVFSFDWTVRLLERLMRIRTPDFAGLLSTLHAGDKLVAAHMGMRSRTVWHYWFPAYAPEYAKYSPGLVLLLMMAEAAEAEGVEVIDMGKGQALYKERLANGAVPLAEGRVELPSLVTAIRRIKRGTESLVRRTPLYHVARIPGRLVTALRRRRRFR